MIPLRHLDLFSGLGGFSLGLRWAGGFETVGFCEIDPYCRAVLARHWPGVPIYDDVRTLDGGTTGSIDIITGGYPCQPFSTAGQRRGAGDDRHLWPEMLRLVAELRPRWVIGENVAGHISMGLDNVLSDLDAIGYTGQPFVIPAAGVGAPHRRDRVWIVAHATSEGFQQRLTTGQPQDAAENKSGLGAESERCGFVVAGADGGPIPEPRLGRGDDGLSAGLESHEFTEHWEDGIPRVYIPRSGDMRVQRLKALGNAVVPQIPMLIGRAILAAEGVAS